MAENQLLGRLAVHNKLITMDQLAHATREQGSRRDDSSLGDILLDLGFIDSRQLQALLKGQREMVVRARAKQAAAGAAPGLEDAPVSRNQPGKTPTRPARPQAELQPSSPPASVAPAPTPPPRSEPEPERPAPSEKPADAEAPSSEHYAHGPLAKSTALPPITADDRSRFATLLTELVASGASDVHIHGGASVKVRIAGSLKSAESSSFDPSRSAQLVLSALTGEQLSEFAEHGEVDVCYSLPGVGRFRANVYRQQRGIDGVFRHIPETPPTLESLGLPRAIAKFVNYHQGMVLCTGPTGCGKSSTLAALVDLINEERKDHILTIEDPIEYLHASKRCLVNQRSVRSHTESFASALRGALREDPDVIVIGELRDLETISLALSAAETGHLVLATLHTNNAIRTLNRLIGAFPADQQGQIRTMMSESLRVVISQRLIPRADGQGRVAAVEKLVITKAVGNLIRENKTFQIQSIMQTGASQGMVLLDDSIKELLREGTITSEQALRFCEDPKGIR